MNEGIPALTHLKDVRCSSTIYVEMNQLTPVLWNSHLSGHNSIKGLKMADEVPLINDSGRGEPGVVGLLETDGACSSAAHINEEGNGYPVIPTDDVHLKKKL